MEENKQQSNTNSFNNQLTVWYEKGIITKVLFYSLIVAGVLLLSFLFQLMGLNAKLNTLLNLNNLFSGNGSGIGQLMPLLNDVKSILTVNTLFSIVEGVLIITFLAKLLSEKNLKKSLLMLENLSVVIFLVSRFIFGIAIGNLMKVLSFIADLPNRTQSLISSFFSGGKFADSEILQLVSNPQQLSNFFVTLMALVTIVALCGAIYLNYLVIFKKRQFTVEDAKQKIENIQK